uniref:Putative secreted protein n=1 Tax=Anopheles darlingi TaxID=43151 RepID=A0A2M4DC57_ANODA
MRLVGIVRLFPITAKALDRFRLLARYFRLSSRTEFGHPLVDLHFRAYRSLQFTIDGFRQIIRHVAHLWLLLVGRLLWWRRWRSSRSLLIRFR